MVYTGSAKRELIFDAVRVMYTDIARDPGRGYHVPVGQAACALVGYPGEQLGRLPASAVESFAGVGYPFAANVIRAGDTVLDIGSGSGTDVLLAAMAVGPSGRVIGLDLTRAMLAKLEATVAAAGVSNVQVLEGNAEHLPLPDASVDVVTSNGVLNLVPDKRAAFAEIGRVLRPGGRLQIADVALGRSLSGDCLGNPKLWAECIVGATTEDDYLAFVGAAGLECVVTLGHLDYFSASTSAETRSIARSFNAGSIVVRAVKPPVSPMPPPSAWPPMARATAQPEESHAATTPVPAADAVVDGYGQLCGTLEPAMKSAMRTLSSGQVLEVRVDDPTARLGVPAWTRLAGHALLATVDDDGGRSRFYLRKR
jgi:arsenite methyltransferase